MSDRNKGVTATDWSLLFYWLMATVSGWVFGWLLLPAVALVTAGIGAGALQAAVLYQRIPKAWQWILASAIGWLGGLALVVPLVPPGAGVVSGAIVGTAAGTAQWAILRRQIRWSGWWIAASAVAWATGMGLAPAPGDPMLPRIVLAGVMAGAMTGTALTVLMRTSQPTAQTTPSEPPE